MPLQQQFCALQVGIPKSKSEGVFQGYQGVLLGGKVPLNHEKHRIYLIFTVIPIALWVY